MAFLIPLTTDSYNIFENVGLDAIIASALILPCCLKRNHDYLTEGFVKLREYGLEER